MTGARLVLLRGNSGSGKSTIAEQLRLRRGTRDVAILGQDNIRRIVLREADGAGSQHVALITEMTRWCLARGTHVVLEGIFHAEWHRDGLVALLAEHPASTCFYLDIGFEETLARHATRAKAAEFGEPEMRQWYRANDLLGVPGEVVIGPGSTLDESVELIGRASGLLA